MKNLFIAIALMLSLNAEAGVRECSEAIQDIGNAKGVEAKCDGLSEADQRRAAEMASKKDGLIIFLAPYEAKKARGGGETTKKWAREFHAAKSSAFDALILKDPIKRKNTAQTILKLRDRAEKLFGNADDCYIAAAGLVDVYQEEINLAMGSPNSHITASGLARMAWEAGQSQHSCETKIDALK